MTVEAGRLGATSDTTVRDSWIHDDSKEYLSVLGSATSNNNRYPETDSRTAKVRGYRLKQFEQSTFRPKKRSGNIDYMPDCITLWRQF